MTEDYAEQAVATEPYYCVVCGPILRTHYPDGTSTMHHLPLSPYCQQANEDEEKPQ